MHCQSASCVLELWVGYSSSLHGRGQALSARTGVLCNHSRAEISPFDLLVGDAAVCMSAGRPSFDSSLAMTQTTCAARAAVPTGQFNWQLFSVTIEIDLAGHAWCSVCRFSIAVTVQWTTASIARSCSPLNQVPANQNAYVPTNFVLLPICLHVYL
jgi:hypothetical protein